MKQSQLKEAAQALVNSYNEYADSSRPAASSKVWRKVITDSLGVKKLYTTRLNQILEIAKTLGLEVNDAGDFVIQKKEEKELPKTKVQISAPPLSKPRDQYMGRLLEAELKDMTSKLDSNTSAATLFCICPNCGHGLKVVGAIEDQTKKSGPQLEEN